MSQRRRKDLLAWAEQHGAAIVEDDYDSEFRYLGRALDPLHTLDTTGRVIYVGSFAKTLLPSLRIGFLLVPASLADAARRAKFVADFGSPTYVQRALAAFIDEGGFGKYIRRMRRIYEQRHHLIRSVLLDDFTDVLEPVDSMAGLHLAARLTVDVRDLQIRRAAQAASIAIRGLSDWSVRDPAPQGLVFGYGGIDADRIPAGLARLREIMPAGRPA
jgi:GntR family transcriptional regulator/MocR family aminotransferase